ncbi:PadR family transcriptional regulator [Pseudonocardia sichuanensis]|uniref:PadR family transcriptional regulator n=1 Tax=Pseudonocardia kunmingensis TaxID=630975 RepID=A0A543E1U5_9PSEU|nr:PadR family transcriptional regulator [Pseudonocardia kunmingensis]TQM15555.1 PadR family transcriptional regulator [Pseudonocardia kunmingensis]
MSLPHALLGLLAVEPRSGYELTKAFTAELGRYAWQAGHTSIYPELGKLAERGLVEVTEEGARGSRTYSVTPAGYAELRSWMLTPRRPAKVRNEQVLRMFLISALEPEDALTLLHGIADRSAAEGAELRRVLGEAPPEIPAGADGFGYLAAEYGLRQYDAVHGWARWAIEKLEARAGAESA